MFTISMRLLAGAMTLAAALGLAACGPDPGTGGGGSGDSGAGGSGAGGSGAGGSGAGAGGSGGACRTAGPLTKEFLPTFGSDTTTRQNPCLAFVDLLGQVNGLIPATERAALELFRDKLAAVATAADVIECGYEKDRLAIAIYQNKTTLWSIGVVAVVRGDVGAVVSVAICALAKQTAVPARLRSAIRGSPPCGVLRHGPADPRRTKVHRHVVRLLGRDVLGTEPTARRAGDHLRLAQGESAPQRVVRGQRRLWHHPGGARRGRPIRTIDHDGRGRAGQHRGRRRVELLPQGRHGQRPARHQRRVGQDHHQRPDRIRRRRLARHGWRRHQTGQALLTVS